MLSVTLRKMVCAVVDDNDDDIFKLDNLRNYVICVIDDDDDDDGDIVVFIN